MKIFLLMIFLHYLFGAVNSGCSSRSPALVIKYGAFKVNYDKYYAKNSIVTASCKAGYTLRGSKMMRCDGSNWKPRSGKRKPSCQKPKCPAPPNIDNGYHQFAQRGKTVFYHCLDGFKINGKRNYLLCQLRNKRWRGKVPRCIAKVKCPRPKDIAFGKVIVGELFEQSEVTFQCNAGNALIGAKILKCLPSRKWDKPPPYCKPNATSCPVPTRKDMPHAIITVDYKNAKFVFPGEFMDIRCKSGFRLEGMNFLYCEEDGKWDAELPTCKVVDGCKVPSAPKNGGIFENVASSTVKAKTVINFYCNETYRLKGSTWAECKYDEFEGVAWSNPVPRCVAIACPEHSPPDNGVKSANGPFYVGSTVSYSCYEGYTLIGSKNRTCEENGMWSGELASCDSGSTVCPDPGVPISGKKEGKNYSAGDVIEYSCYPGYHLRGNSTRVCKSNGYWSGIEVLCRGPNEFDYVPALSATLINQLDKMKLVSEKSFNTSQQKILKKSSFNNTARSLDLGNPNGLNIIFIFDSSGSVGQKGFETAKNFAVALVQYIGAGENGVVRFAAITFSSDVTVNFYTEDFKKTEDVINEIKLIKYKPGDTATNPALKKARTDVIPLAHLHRSASKTAIFLITDGRANIRGSPKQEADLIVKEYENTEIYAIGVGSRILESELAAVAHPKDENDKHYMKVENYGKVNELLQFLINGTIDYSACGLLQRPIEKKPPAEKVAEQGLKRQKRSNRLRIVGGETVSKHWPWMAGLYYKGNQLRCGASLISNSWLITAAHCWKTYSNNLKRDVTVSVNEVRVHLGITNIEDPEQSLLIAEPDKVIIYPKYEPKLYVNDIALIHLRRPARFNALIRPVCLPPASDRIPKDSFLYKPGELSVVTGWGHTKKRERLERLDLNTLQQSRILKKLVLPLKARKVCEDSLIDDRDITIVKFTESMICAGTGKGGNDSCQSDSGGPLHQKLVDPNGDGIYYTQIGIVSWGIGCALEGEYGFYTNVAKFIPWIEKETGLKLTT